MKPQEKSLDYYTKTRDTNLKTYQAKMAYMRTVKEQCIAKYQNSLSTIEQKIASVVDKYEKSLKYYDTLIKKIEQKNLEENVKASVAQSLKTAQSEN